MKNEPTNAKTLFRSDAMQRIMAFSALIVLFIGFSVASPYFRTFDNFVGILLEHVAEVQLSDTLEGSYVKNW